MSLSDSQVRATVAVSAIGPAHDFYSGKLGLSAQPGGPDEVRMYECGNGTVVQVYESQFAGSTGATVVSWSDPDFDATVSALRDAGIALETYEGLPSEEGVHTFGEHSVVWFKDPDGNVISVDNGGMPT